MGLIQLLFKNPVAFFTLSALLIYSVIAHEMAHGVAAYFFGDDTAKRAGRLTLNPFRHIDPVGTLMVFIIGFGWAKPVPVNFLRLRPFRPALIVVSFAGCFVNIIIATIALFLMQFQFAHANPFISSILLIVARINIILGAFNLIPIPPLDGSKLLMGFLPKRAQVPIMRLEPYGIPILIVLLFTGLLDPVIRLMMSLVLLFIKLVLGQ